MMLVLIFIASREYFTDGKITIILILILPAIRSTISSLLLLSRFQYYAAVNLKYLLGHQDHAYLCIPGTDGDFHCDCRKTGKDHLVPSC